MSPLNHVLKQVQDMVRHDALRIPHEYFVVKQKIGIKYCGGCNPTYERVEFIHRVQSLMEDRFSFLRHGQQCLDLLLLINGCPRACAVGNLNKSSTFQLGIKPRRKIFSCHSSPQQSCGVFWKVLDKPEVPYHSITEESDFENLILWLMALDEKGEKNGTNCYQR